MLWLVLKFVGGIFALCSLALACFLFICLFPESDK
jgi:hypothetical protein